MLQLVGVPFRPLRQGLVGYNMAKFRADLLAGLSVAVVSIPQGMAYAFIAGLHNPVYGIYTVIFQSLIGAIFNSQPLLSMGPTNTQSLLVAATVTRLADPGNEQLYLQLVISLTLLKGVIQLGMSLARLGHLVRYVSHSVVVGFSAGAGVLIAAGQINSFLGFRVERSAADWPGLIGVAQRVLPKIEHISLPAMAIGLGSLALVLVCRRISKLLPGPLLAVILGAGLVAVVGWTNQDLSLVPAIPSALPMPAWPVVDRMHLDALLVGAAALAILGMLEAYTIGKTLAIKTDTGISANQELFSQGMANFVTSFFSCIPGSGSFARSALNHFAGARTMVAGLFNALFVLIIFLLLAPGAKYIPMSAIAAILFVIAANLIDVQFFRRVLKSNRADAIVCVGTFTATIFLPLDYAVFAGIFLNIALYLRRARQLYITEMVRKPGVASGFIERPVRETAGDRSVMFLQIEGNLFFASADELHERFTALYKSGAKVIILRLKRTHMVDATVMNEIEEFAKHLRSQNRWLLLCGLRPRMKERMDEFGLTQTIGDENMFVAEAEVYESAKRALTRARELVGEIDPEQADGFANLAAGI